MNYPAKDDDPSRIEALSFAIDEIYIQLRTIKRVLEEKGILTDDDFRETYKKEVMVSPGNQAPKRYSDELSKRRKSFLGK